MSEQPSLNTARLLLRPFETKDAPTVQKLAGVREVSDMTEAIPHPYEDGMAEEWIATHAQTWNQMSGAIYAVCDLKTKLLIGCVGLTIAKQHNRATLGYWVGVEFWGNGYCSESAKALLDFAFNTLNLNRIDAIHLTHNPASGAVLRKIGMLHEGTHRQYVFNNNIHSDVESYAILAADFHS